MLTTYNLFVQVWSDYSCSYCQLPTITENLAFLAQNLQISKTDHFGVRKDAFQIEQTQKFDYQLGNTPLRNSLGWYHFIWLSVSHDCSPTI